MSTSFKTLLANDVSKTRSLIYENVPIDGSIADHTNVYGTYPANTSVNTLYHGRFQQVFDYIASNASANHIFDISLGVHADSYAFSTAIAANEPYDAWATGTEDYDSTKDSCGVKRRAMYNLMAQILVGYGSDGSILKFDKDGDFAGTTTDKYNEAIILTFSRLLTKDGIKKGSFDLRFNMNPYGETLNGGNAAAATHPDDQADWDGTATGLDSELKITDYNGSTNYRDNSPAGEYGILYAEDADSTLGVGGAADGILDGTVLGTSQRVPCGLIYYQAGVAIIDPWLFRVYNDNSDGHGYLNALAEDDSGTPLAHDSFWMYYDRNGTYGTVDPQGAGAGSAEHFFSIEEMLRGYEEAGGTNDYEDITIDEFANALRQRIHSITFNNTTELNSSVYHCRAAHNEFNYSSNPTYTSASKIVTKDVSNDEPVTYVTGVGLYSADNELLAVGKVSEPIKKTPAAGMTIRARIDY
jgi:hypothetical protein